MLDNITNNYSNMMHNDTTTWMSDNSTWANSTEDGKSEAISTDSIPDVIYAIYFLFRGIWSCLSFGGNALTIFVVFNYDNLRTNTNFLICSLAASDLIAGFVTPMAVVRHVYKDLPQFIPSCLIEQGFSLCSTTLNLLNILWIAIDRYIYIAYPLKYPHIVTNRKTSCVVIITWLYAVTAIPILIIFGNKLRIGDKCSFSTFVNKTVYNAALSPSALVLMSLTIGFHFAIARIAQIQARRIASMNQPYDTLEAASNRRQWKILKMMSIVLGTYLLSIMPQLIMITLIRNNPNLAFAIIEKVTVLLFWSNTWINPVIYAWRDKRFRQAFKKQFDHCRLCINSQATVGSQEAIPTPPLALS